MSEHFPMSLSEGDFATRLREWVAGDWGPRAMFVFDRGEAEAVADRLDRLEAWERDHAAR